VVVRFHATKNLAKNEMGCLTLGTDSSPFGISIPPGMPNFPIQSYCYKDCTDRVGLFFINKKILRKMEYFFLLNFVKKIYFRWWLILDKNKKNFFFKKLTKQNMTFVMAIPVRLN
jgi:hypothetical protein